MAATVTQDQLYASVDLLQGAIEWGFHVIPVIVANMHGPLSSIQVHGIPLHRLEILSLRPGRP